MTEISPRTRKMALLPHHAWLVALAALACVAPAHASASGCLGEFTLCPSGECTMSNSTCGACKPTEYLCPSDLTTCVPSAAAYTRCPGMAGTHFDVTLSVEQRLDYLVAKVISLRLQHCDAALGAGLTNGRRVPHARASPALPCPALAPRHATPRNFKSPVPAATMVCVCV